MWLVGLVLLGFLVGEVAEAATHQTGSCAAATVQSVITNTAASGDTVQLTPAGCSVTWSAGSVTIPSSKRIILDGNGATVAQSGTGFSLTLQVNTTGASEVKNFTFTSSSSGFSNTGIGLVGVTGCTYSTGSPNASFRIHHNAFSASDISMLTVACHGRGLIDHNTFTDTSSVNNESPTSFGNGSAGWAEAITPGSLDAPVFEDNTFSGGGTGNKTFMVDGGRVVFRFNTFRGKLIDVHGNTGVKGRWWEVYNNAFVHTASNQPSWMIFRGGSGVVFSNTRSVSGGSGFGAESIDMYYDSDSTVGGCGYPGLYQVGRGQSQALTPAFFFLNASTAFSFSLNAECAGMVQQDRDFYTDRSGSTGVRSGTIAARPATCTTGQGYWATDEGGNWNTLGGGANDGRLYKCTSTNTWTLYMTPATYPHPLQLQSGAASCSSTDVQAAITAATDGATVSVPAGSCTWTGSGVVTWTNKNITLQGAGIGTTIISIATGEGLRIPATNTGAFRITGFTFRSTGNFGTDSGWAMMGIRGGQGWRIDNNRFEVHSTVTSYDGGNAVYMIGNVGGLLDHNQFVKGTGSGCFHAGVYIEGMGNTAWGLASQIGGATNVIYIEDNYFYHPDACSSHNAHAVYAQTGGIYVARHNDINGMNIDSHGFCANYGAREYEISNNTWTGVGSNNLFSVVHLRGATGVVYGNVFNGNITWAYWLEDYRAQAESGCGFSGTSNVPGYGNVPANQPCPEGWPCAQQIGRGQNNSTDTLYIWNNTGTGTLTNSAGSTYIQSGRDYVLNGGAKPGYTAYTYPHPLQGGGTPPDITPPAAPTGVSISKVVR